ncbi:hypothetical protein A1359_20005 [Methylomonas lenta]|uniref:PEP-CTERM protein-sorting domain-containing protein n=1 Tax=Methylomonas lenta TaxID=980561 RepID=A0A177NSI1_9GAMM|nr:hypothetical protein [Methylomonas lenta]OAI20945.1 hypothetical protein A1359_20005 [Methylomonas lenta]
MFRKTLIASLLCLSTVEANAALSSGDLAFTSFNADEDGWSLVTFVDIAADSTIYFSDNEWDGSAFNSGESFHTWNTGLAGISAGTVIRFSSIDTDARTASFGTLSGSGSNFGISATSETIYAYLGSDINTPSTFLTGISSEGTANLTPAGLADGINAVVLTNSADYAEYIGARAGEVNFSDYRTQVNNAANWSILVGGAQEAQIPDTTSFSAVPVPGAVWLFGSALACFTAVGGRRKA